MKDVVTLDGIEFPYSLDSLQWSYKLRTSSQDTLGGRVVQLLGMQAESLTISGKAGSYNKLKSLAGEVVKIMKKHISTGNAVDLIIPSRDLKFSVYVQSMPSFEKTLQSVSYPYSLNLKVQHSEVDIRSNVVLGAALSRLFQGVGYQTGWSGSASADVDIESLASLGADSPLGELLSSLLGVSIGG